MRTLSKAVEREEAGGDKLPVLFRTFDANGINFRRGNVHIVAGLPGGGKTVLAMEAVKRLNAHKIPSLYIVPDSDELTIAGRYLMQSQRMKLPEVERRLKHNRRWAAEQFEYLEYVRWNFEPVDLPTIENDLAAFVEAWGESPGLTVIDNLIDVDVAGSEQEALRAAAKALKFLADDYNTAMLLLHHTSEAVEPVKREDGVKAICQPRSALWGKDARAAALALTVAYVPGVPGQGGLLHVAAVKNRHGAADPSGATSIYLGADLERMQIREITDPVPLYE